MTLELTGPEIRDMFNAGERGKLTLECHTLHFGGELEQEHGMAIYEQGGWRIIEAGLSIVGEYYFKAVQKWQSH